MRPGNVPEHLFPSSFYVFSRHSFTYSDTFIQGIVHVYRKDGMTDITGRETIFEMRKQSLPIDKYAREFRGMVLAMDTGLGMLVSLRRFMTGSFNFVAPVPPPFKTTTHKAMRCAHRGNSPPHRVPRVWCNNIFRSGACNCTQIWTVQHG